jgi:GTP cyclohydrolase I
MSLHVYRSVNTQTFLPEFIIIDDVFNTQTILPFDEISEELGLDLKSFADKETMPMSYWQWEISKKGPMTKFVCEELKGQVKPPMGAEWGKELTTGSNSLIDDLWSRIKDKGLRAWSNDNVAEIFKSEEEKTAWIDELSVRFESVLDGLLIDYKNDPNAHGTPKRLAKMFANEIDEGRFTPAPVVTAFPNDSENQYKGMLVVRVEIDSTCAHHWMPMKIVGFIGVIPQDKLIGLSKFSRVSQHLGRRKWCQENLCSAIADEIKKYTESEHVGVYLQGTHGCASIRGVKLHSSLTQTTVLQGHFMDDASTKKEFFDNIALQNSSTMTG